MLTLPQKKTVQKHDENERVIMPSDVIRIPIDDVYDVQSDIITAFMPDEMCEKSYGLNDSFA